MMDRLQLPVTRDELWKLYLVCRDAAAVRADSPDPKVQEEGQVLRDLADRCDRFYQEAISK